MSKTSKQCEKCKWLHIGENVDHNHCDVEGGSERPYTNPDRYGQRANGHNNSKCSKFKSN